MGRIAQAEVMSQRQGWPGALLLTFFMGQVTYSLVKKSGGKTIKKTTTFLHYCP